MAVMLASAGCGSPPLPTRGVLERDLSSWNFRRYQTLLDVEVWVPQNRARAYTASYVRAQAEKVGRLHQSDVAHAFVTRYQKESGIADALVKFCRRLAQEKGYAVEERELGGARVFAIAGAGEAWVTWAARRHVIKIGGRGLSEVPEPVVEAYADRYRSRLKPGMLEGL